MSLSIYLASSWRNAQYPSVLSALREAGHIVYDWRDPHDGRPFAWAEINPGWQGWSPAQFRDSLGHPLAVAGFERDAAGMWCSQVCVLLLPCGRSAHLEAGWFLGQGRPVLILLAEGCEPELMYRGVLAADGGLCLSLDELLADLERVEADAEPRCHKCGCTEFEACEGGCGWVHADPWLCSACDQDDKTDERAAGDAA
jgi:hypothetical protein